MAKLLPINETLIHKNVGWNKGILSTAHDCTADVKYQLCDAPLLMVTTMLMFAIQINSAQNYAVPSHSIYRHNIPADILTPRCMMVIQLKHKCEQNCATGDKPGPLSHVLSQHLSCNI